MAVPDTSERTLIGRELTMVCRAIQQGWEMPEHARANAISRLAEIIGDPASTKREVSRASVALIAMDRLRLQAVTTANAVADIRPQVVINNNVGQADTLEAFLAKLSPEDAQEWLDKFGADEIRASTDAT